MAEQLTLLKVAVSKEINGIEMGVLEDGTGLSAASEADVGPGLKGAAMAAPMLSLMSLLVCIVVSLKVIAPRARGGTPS